MAQAALKRKTKTAGKKSRCGKYYYDRRKAERPIEWIEEYCTHPKGNLSGQPLKLPDWAKNDVIKPAFGTLRKNGKRRYTIVYVELPRGNAKSTIASAIGLFMLVGARELTPDINCVAGSKDQAALVFEPAKIMVQQNDELASMLEVFGNSIYDSETFGVMRVISADGKLQHGKNSTCTLFDELHVQPNGNLFEALTTGNVKRDEPIVFVFTTAGVKGSFAESIHDYAVGVRDGVINDDSFLPIIYCADDGDDIFSEETWKKANPGWSYLNHDEFRAAAQKAKNSAQFRNSFCRYNLNMWTGTTTVWMTDETFMHGHSKGFTHESLTGRECYVGIDLSSNRDTTAAVFCFPPITEEERWKFIARVFIPQDTLLERTERETVQYQNWAKDGHIILTPGSTQNQEFIREDINRMAKMYLIKGIGYDSWNANDTVKFLEAGGLPMLAYQQNFRWMSVPMKKIEQLMVEDKIEHNGHPVLRWHCQSLMAEENASGFIRPTRKKGEKTRIDAMVAMIVSVGTHIIIMAEEMNKPAESIIKSQGVFTIKGKQ